MKRIFLIVLDSFGIGGAPDAADFGDEGEQYPAGGDAVAEIFAPQLKNWAFLQSMEHLDRKEKRLPARLAG